MPEPSARLIRPREAAKILGISYSTLKRWIHTKQLRSVKTRGGHHRIPESELDRHLYRATRENMAAERQASSAISADEINSSVELSISR